MWKLEKEILMRDSYVQKSQSYMISLCILVEFQSSHQISVNIQLFEVRECTCTCIVYFLSVEILCTEGTGTIEAHALENLRNWKIL
jgi:hypothetical protein